MRRRSVAAVYQLVAIEAVDLVSIYECFCERTRLRSLYLLTKSRLCVCHLQDILGERQVKVSKHLAYLRRKGMVRTDRDRNWIVYSLPKAQADELAKNLKCLQECAR